MWSKYGKHRFVKGMHVVAAPERIHLTWKQGYATPLNGSVCMCILSVLIGAY